MELKEAIEILKGIKKYTTEAMECSCLSASKKEEWGKEIQAIDTVLQVLEELQKDTRNRAIGCRDLVKKCEACNWKECIGCEYSISDIKTTLNNFVSKGKIKEKIEEIKYKLTSKDFTHDMYIGTDKHIFWEHLCAKKDVLEELLKGE